jgi:gentisate 1,2-dioxygenase
MAMIGGDLMTHRGLHEMLARQHLRGLWQLPPDAIPTTPNPVTEAWHWCGDDVMPLAHEAGHIGVADDRRALLLTNPALSPSPFTTTTLQGAVQSLPSGNAVAANRHTPSALRFILSGGGSYRTADGTEHPLSAGDLLLTPHWSWHEYTNHSEEPMVWFDGLDFPVAARLESATFDDRPARTPSRSSSGPLHRPWSMTDRLLTEKYDDSRRVASVQFTDPITGGVILLTFDCWMHRMGPLLKDPATRKTGNSIFVVFSGHGVTTVGHKEFEWAAGDIFVVPSWLPVQHRPGEVSNLLEMTDRPILQSLGLYREETL